MKFKLLKGFTLAELLITLSIVGVVAAMVIPALLNNYNDNNYKNLFKKFYGSLSQGSRQMMADYGGTMSSVFASCPDDSNKYNCMNNLFASYFKVTKICNLDEGGGNCWHNINSKGKYYSGKTIVHTWKTRFAGWNPAGFILSDGSFFVDIIPWPDCQPNTSERMCAIVYIDTNGSKGPNTIGKDVYEIWINENSITPNYYSNMNDFDINNGCSTPGNMDDNNTGFTCGIKWLKE